MVSFIGSVKHRKRSSWRPSMGSINHGENIQTEVSLEGATRTATENERQQKSPTALINDAASTGSAVSSPESTTAQSWVIHHFHENQSYTISSFPASEVATRQDPVVSRAPSQNAMSDVCQLLGVSRTTLSNL